ncbi:diphthamide synthesis protein [Candidatus Woesearchaeota archaeon]|nr:diphthamide synthesis protein [Candidatus Woesearchaeota archaeon]
MGIIFMDAKWDKEIKLGEEVIEYLEEYANSVALFASVQFLNLDTVKQQLRSRGIEIRTTKAKRTDEEEQILGCDCYPDSFAKGIIPEADAILYIGDGMFHPQALLLAQMHTDKKKEIITWNPAAEKMRIIKPLEVKKNLAKYKANVMRFMSAKNIGIMVTTKPGQQFLEKAIELKDGIAAKGKKAYIFLDDSVSLNQTENFNFIECWVNTACPRIGLDDILHLERPMINIKEAFEPEKALEQIK